MLLFLSPVHLLEVVCGETGPVCRLLVNLHLIHKEERGVCVATTYPLTLEN